MIERDIAEWKRQCEICSQRFEEFCNDQMKVFDATSTPLKFWVEQYEEECKFEEIQEAADEAFEYVAKHTRFLATKNLQSEKRRRKKAIGVFENENKEDSNFFPARHANVL